ncbi:MAG: VOC family protein [Actinomycetota bacterium]|nr:VOC family protein [Actinomycetota bacterium]
MHKIVPHLWFDKEAVEAAEFYVSTFSNSRITNLTTLYETPSGDSDVVAFELSGQPFMAISAGPLFQFNPSVSFLVSCETKEEVDELWSKLSEGGRPLMPLASYPFSELYGWTEDKYGLSWQIMHAGEQEIGQKITPTLMFVGKVCGKAEEAIKLYTSVFRDSRIRSIVRYGEGEDPDEEGTIKHASFTLEGQTFAAMDSARDHDFAFNEAISLMVNCETQEDIDYYWSSLSAVPEAEQCGWLKDRYGFSWQVVPLRMEEMMRSGSKDQIARVSRAFLEMKKFDVAELERAYEGRDSQGRR